MKIFWIFYVYFNNVSLVTIFIVSFVNFSSNFDRLSSSIHLKSPTGNFCDIAYPYKLFASKYSKYEDSILLLKFFIYLLLAFAYLCTALHIPPLIPFSTIISISLSVNNSDFTFVFLNKLAKLIQELIRNELDQVCKY